MNVIGFTMNFYQVYSSIYVAKYLMEKYKNFRFIFVFGGSSAVEPKVLELIRKLKIDGFTVVGEGEKKLELFIKAILRHPDPMSDNLLDNLEDKIEGIYSIKTKREIYQREKKDFATQFLNINDLPLPNYDEYFRTLKSAYKNKEIYNFILKNKIRLPIEGSRGCFAHCDFCGLNIIWDGFRKFHATQVVQRTKIQWEKHKPGQVFFTDNVCDTWARDYANDFIANKVKIPAMMDLRAHHSQQYWTRLALAGLQNIQIGVESFSENLLIKMNKGTTALQNIKAQKHFKELGIRSLSNLITHHPKSTLEDVKETRRILEYISHYDELKCSEFRLDYGSPLYEGLSLAQRKNIKPNLLIHWPKQYVEYVIGRSYYLPQEIALNKKVAKAWDRFTNRHLEKDYSKDQLMVHRMGKNQLHIYDNRQGFDKDFYLEGKEAQVYDVCHQGLKISRICEITGIGIDEVLQYLKKFIKKKIILRIQDSYLSVALRPRDELIHEYYSQKAMNENSTRRSKGQTATPSTVSH